MARNTRPASPTERPAVVDDYNYPYKSSSGAVGTQYFYQQLANKILYCDTTSPFWPRNGTIIGCTAGGTPTCGGVACPVTQQTCNLNTPAKTCNPTPASRNFTPAGCKPPLVTPALWCAPSTGGSDSFSSGTGTVPECQACTCNADYQPANTKKCSVTGAACTSVCGSAGLRHRRVPGSTRGAERLQHGGADLWRSRGERELHVVHLGPGRGRVQQCLDSAGHDASAGFEQSRRRLPPQQPVLCGERRSARRLDAVHLSADEHQRCLRREQDRHCALHAAGQVHDVDDRRLPDDRREHQYSAALLHDRLGRSSATTSTLR